MIDIMNIAIRTMTTIARLAYIYNTEARNSHKRAQKPNTVLILGNS